MGSIKTNDDLEQLEKLKLERIKDSWHHSSPSKLFDLCINKIVHNIDIILVKNEPKKSKESLDATIINKDDGKTFDNDDKSAKQSVLIDTSYVTLKNKKFKSNNIDDDPSSNKRLDAKLSSRKFKKRKKQPKKSKKPNTKFSLKYVLRDDLSPLPNIVCHSILTQYSKYYLDKLSEIERDVYFQIGKFMNTSSTKPNADTIDQANASSLSHSSSLPQPTASQNAKSNGLNLINFYDLLMAFATRPDKCNLNTINYRQCIWSHSTLEQRLKVKYQSRLYAQQEINRNYFELSARSSSSSLSSDSDTWTRYNDCITYIKKKFSKKRGANTPRLVSLRSKQKAHLTDFEVRLMLKNQKNLNTLDVCPCMLTNKTILLINKYFSQSLKSLRFQNCCNWQQNKLQNSDQNQQHDDPLDLRHYMTSSNDEDDDDDDDEEDDDDAGNEDYFNDDYTYRPGFKNNTLNNDSNYENLVDVDQFMADVEELRSEQVYYNPDEDEDDDDEYIASLENNENDDEYHNSLNKDISSNYNEEYADDDDDDANFHAYLQEYVSKYEQQEQDTEKKSELLSLTDENKKSGCKSKHHHHHHHHHRHHHHKRRSSKHKKHRDHKKTMVIRDENKLYNYLLARRLAEKFKGQCKLFQPAIPKIKPCSKSDACQKIQIQTKERKHKRKHRSKNNEMEVASEKEPKGNISKKRKFKKDKHKSEDNINILRKNSKLNESLAEENSNSNQPGTSSSFNAKQSSVESTNNQTNDKESSSLLKWIVKRAVSNTNITGASSSNASKLNEASVASAEAKTSQDSSNNSSSKKSLIEQIKKKAAFLTETKLLDKVSISSSNYDDYDLNNLNESQFNKLDEGDELTYDEISQFTNENSSLNSKQGLSIQDEAECAHMENIATRSVNNNNESSNLFKYDSIDSLTSASMGSSSSASSSSGSKLKSNNSSVYLSYENDDYNSSSNSSSSCSSSSSLITSLSIRSASLSSHSSDSLCSSYFSSSSCSESSSPSSDYDDNDLMFNNEIDKSKIETSSAANINDNDEEALKLLERRYLRKKKEKSNKKSKFSIRKALKKRLEPKEAKNANNSEQQRSALNNNDEENNNSNNNEHRILTSRKVMREQRLLEKVANLGSSPINVIQAIAAKALNFKLKNSLANSSTAASSTNSPCDANDTDSKASLAKYNRLLRHYKFLKSTNIKMNKLDESSKTKLSDNDDEQEIYNEKMVNDLFSANNKSNEDELTKLMDQDEQGNGGEEANSKRLFKEIELENEAKNEENNNNSQQASSLINNEASDVDMEMQSNQPGTSKSFSDQNQHNLPSNLFSALKEWMSKRVDSLSSGNTSTNMSKSMSYDESKKSEQSELIAADPSSKASSSKLNKRKTRNKLKTIKTMSSFSISTESAESLASNKSMKSESPSSSSSTTFDSFNSIIETNSINKIFEEKFQQIDSANNSTEHNSTAKNTSGEGASSTLNDNADSVELNESSSQNTQSTDYVSLKQIKFKKKLEKMKKHTKSVSESHDGLLEEQNDTNSLNRAAFRLEKVENKKIEEKKSEKRNKQAANKYKLTDPSRSLIQTINLSQLQHLSLRNLGQDVIKRTMLNSLLKNFKCLKYLDISNCCTNQLHYFKPTTPFDPMRSNNLDKALKLNSKDENNPLNTDKQLAGGLDGLVSLAPTLTHLIMADLGVEDIQANLAYLLKMKRVAHLDISNCREKLPLNAYKNPSLLLGKLAFHLSSLRSLDISGTNLGGSIIFKEADEIDYIKKRLYEDLIDDCNDYQRVRLDQVVTIASGISGLMFLNNEKRVLDFLGFFGCDNSLSSRSNIPALRIAGEEIEKHLYTSLETFMNDRPLFLLDALNHLFELYRDELIEDKLLGGHLIMNTMEKHLDNSRIQISGSASLFYVLKYSKEEDIQLPPFYLKRLIKTVINGMEEHIEESAVSLHKYLKSYIILFINF